MNPIYFREQIGIIETALVMFLIHGSKWKEAGDWITLLETDIFPNAILTLQFKLDWFLDTGTNATGLALHIRAKCRGCYCAFKNDLAYEETRDIDLSTFPEIYEISDRAKIDNFVLQIFTTIHRSWDVHMEDIERVTRTGFEEIRNAREDS